jgi:hypothetical protein
MAFVKDGRIGHPCCKISRIESNTRADQFSDVYENVELLGNHKPNSGHKHESCGFAPEEPITTHSEGDDRLRRQGFRFSSQHSWLA